MEQEDDNNKKFTAQEEEDNDKKDYTRLNSMMDFTSVFTTDMIFKSKESMIEWTRNTGKEHGLVIVMKLSEHATSSRKPRVIFSCERSGSYRPSKRVEHIQKRRRLTGTKKCGCPFLLKGEKLSTNDEWVVKVMCGIHNHPRALHLEGHSYAGRLSKEEINILVEMSKNNAKPKDILYCLKQRDGNNVSTIKTMYNVRHKQRIVEKAGRSQMQYLLSKLSEHNYIEWHRTNYDSDSVRDIFWAHPASIDLLRAFPRVLVMDCTYKTNRYRLPLLEIVGITSTQLTFSIAFAYLESEREDNYTWALDRLKTMMDANLLPSVIVTDRELALMNAIDNVFPAAKHILCRWHISKNILAKCKKYFEMQDAWEAFIISWNVLVLSSSEQEYLQQLSSLQSTYSKYPQALEYVIEAWLSRYKEKFISAWTNSIMHFGNLTTNRVESAHAKLKRQLQSSQGNFESSWEKIHSLMELLVTEIKASFEKSLTIVQHNYNHALFKELRGFVSRHAMKLLLEESKRAESIGMDAYTCGCVLQHTHGLPCAHEISEYKLAFQPIPLSCIESHWRKLDMLASTINSGVDLTCKTELDMIYKRFENSDYSSKIHLLRKLKELANPSSTILVEPEIKKNVKGRPRKKVDHSTRRDPSAFEYVSEQKVQSYALPTKSVNKKTDKVHQKPLFGETAQPSLQSIKSLKMDNLRFHRKPLLDSFLYRDSFPEGLRPYIQTVKDVLPDGNCGFRAIADLLGMGEDNWAQVRMDLIAELNSHKEEYTKLYGYQERVDELLHSLMYFENFPKSDRWLTMPDMGHLISSHYNVVLMHISMQQCLTFLPLRSTPMPISSRRVITIGFVNGNHFVQVIMLSGSPMPPITINWQKHHQQCAKGWATPYATHIKVFCDLIGDDVATQETINLDSP